jgi:Spy/CpxP family protein refolding chaperone
MTKFKKVLFGVIGLFIFMALPLVHAENQGPGRSSPQGHSGHWIQEIYSQLSLTDAQKEQLEANKQQHRARMESVRRIMKADKEELKAELMKPRLDILKINGLHRQIKVLLSQMEDIKLSSILAVRAILTPEQFSKFVNLMRRHKQGHEE